VVDELVVGLGRHALSAWSWVAQGVETSQFKRLLAIASHLHVVVDALVVEQSIAAAHFAPHIGSPTSFMHESVQAFAGAHESCIDSCAFFAQAAWQVPDDPVLVELVTVDVPVVLDLVLLVPVAEVVPPAPVLELLHPMDAPTRLRTARLGARKESVLMRGMLAHPNRPR